MPFEDEGIPQVKEHPGDRYRKIETNGGLHGKESQPDPFEEGTGHGPEVNVTEACILPGGQEEADGWNSEEYTEEKPLKKEHSSVVCSEQGEPGQV